MKQNALLSKKNAGKTFQRLMDNMLQGAEKYANLHQDDIIITSDTLLWAYNEYQRCFAASA